MMWLFAVLAVLLMGGAALVAAGRGGSMAEVYDDRPDALVPVDGPLTGADLREVRFTTAVRGYRMSEVDALLDRLAGELVDRSTDGSRSRSRGSSEDRSGGGSGDWARGEGS